MTRGFECNKCGMRVTPANARRISTPISSENDTIIDLHDNCGGILEPVDLITETVMWCFDCDELALPGCELHKSRPKVLVK